MAWAMLTACCPWLGLLVGAFVAARLVVRACGGRADWQGLAQLHRDQAGSAQSLSFVLALPLFVMIMLFIVQVSQLMIGTVIVHYAAYATARSAIVWIPADLGEGEGANCVNMYYVDPEAADQVIPTVNPFDANYGPTAGGLTYVVAPGSPKYDKITSAAVLACMPIAPSRDLGLSVTGSGLLAVDILQGVYQAAAEQAESVAAAPRRLRNKFAYSVANTEVEIRFFHRNSEPPLMVYSELIDEQGNMRFRFNEIGWQDPITVKVKHQLALLPGPGRLLARRVQRPDGQADDVSETIQRGNGIYQYPLEASITMTNEGEQPAERCLYHVY